MKTLDQLIQELTELKETYGGAMEVRYAVNDDVYNIDDVGVTPITEEDGTEKDVIVLE